MSNKKPKKTIHMIQQKYTAMAASSEYLSSRDNSGMVLDNVPPNVPPSVPPPNVPPSVPPPNVPPRSTLNLSQFTDPRLTTAPSSGPLHLFDDADAPTHSRAQDNAAPAHDTSEKKKKKKRKKNKNKNNNNNNNKNKKKTENEELVMPDFGDPKYDNIFGDEDDDGAASDSADLMNAAQTSARKIFNDDFAGGISLMQGVNMEMSGMIGFQRGAFRELQQRWHQRRPPPPQQQQQRRGPPSQQLTSRPQRSQGYADNENENNKNKNKKNKNKKSKNKSNKNQTWIDQVLLDEGIGPSDSEEASQTPFSQKKDVVKYKQRTKRMDKDVNFDMEFIAEMEFQSQENRDINNTDFVPNLPRITAKQKEKYTVKCGNAACDGLLEDGTDTKKKLFVNLPWDQSPGVESSGPVDRECDECGQEIHYTSYYTTKYNKRVVNSQRKVANWSCMACGYDLCVECHTVQQGILDKKARKPRRKMMKKYDKKATKKAHKEKLQDLKASADRKEKEEMEQRRKVDKRNFDASVKRHKEERAKLEAAGLIDPMSQDDNDDQDNDY